VGHNTPAASNIRDGDGGGDGDDGHITLPPQTIVPVRPHQAHCWPVASIPHYALSRFQQR
jgi:hypothetical protein